jgi:hypothetical protein
MIHKPRDESKKISRACDSFSLFERLNASRGCPSGGETGTQKINDKRKAARRAAFQMASHWPP